MKETIDAMRDRLNGHQVRERIFALFVLGTIAIVAMVQVDDPENVVINIIVAIGAFSAGKSANNDQRTTDKKE